MLTVGHADQSDGDARIVDEETECAFDNGFSGLGADEIKAVRVLRDDAATERVHDDDGFVERVGSGEGFFAQGEVHCGITEQDAFKGIVAEDGGDFVSLHMGRDDDVADQAFLLEFLDALQGAFGTTVVPCLLIEEAPDVIEIEGVHLQALEGCFAVTTDIVGGGAEGFRGNIERALGLGSVHFLEGDAHEFLGFAVARRSIEIVDAGVVAGFDEVGAGVDVGLIGESHAAEAEG